MNGKAFENSAFLGYIVAIKPMKINPNNIIIIYLSYEIVLIKFEFSNEDHYCFSSRIHIIIVSIEEDEKVPADMSPVIENER